MKALLLLVLVCCAREGLSAPQEDLITNLPGLTWQPNFKQYSGYLQGVGTKKLHYWFVEFSVKPATVPVVLWLNGGPGCSSLDGLLQEHGPFKIKDDGENLQPNPYSWNQVANIIYMESPAGVGFSYSDDGNYTTDDDEAATNNHLALQDFFRKFPEYKGNDFYITGESYAGVYVPTLASVVLDDPNINLKGFAVGNGLSDRDMNDNSLFYFHFYHGLIGTEDWFRVLHICCPGNETEMWCDFMAGKKKYTQCESETAAIDWLLSGLNPYNLYAECVGGGTDHDLHYSPERNKFVTNNFGWPSMFLKGKAAELDARLSIVPAGQLTLEPPCLNNTVITNYLNRPDTRSALNIPDDVDDWEICSNVVHDNYVRTHPTTAPQYQKAITRKLRILVYNGDVDMACNYLGAEWFVDSLQVQNPLPRKPWFYRAEDGTKQVAGYVKSFDNLNYVTVRGAGHMVPEYKPIPALKMFVNFIQDIPF